MHADETDDRRGTRRAQNLDFADGGGDHLRYASYWRRACGVSAMTARLTPHLTHAQMTIEVAMILHRRASERRQ